MQNYMNPSYYGQYPQYQNYGQPMNAGLNPYADRLAQLQAQQAQMQMTNSGFTTLGKIVEGIDIVKSTDIPMDGNMYYFPKADGSELYSKQWMPNGQTRILTFKPILEGEAQNASNNEEKATVKLSEKDTEAFMRRFDDILNRIEDMEKNIKPVKSRKEVNADE